MLGPFINATEFLINVGFDFYILILTLRVLLVAAKVDYFNPISQWVLKLTQPLINPLQKMIPASRKFDSNAFLLIFIFEIIRFSLICLLMDRTPSLQALIFLATGDIIKTFCNLYFYLILGIALLSWIPHSYSTLERLANQLTYPLLQPLRSRLPLIGGIDLTPFITLIGIQLIIILAANPLMTLGMVNL